VAKKSGSRETPLSLEQKRISILAMGANDALCGLVSALDWMKERPALLTQKFYKDNPGFTPGLVVFNPKEWENLVRHFTGVGNTLRRAIKGK
jgi:hypothetical protein